jgi:hypothetical protein
MTTATPLKTIQAPRRMALANVEKGKRVRPIRALLHGTEGVGKSTFGASAPNPIFLCAESGTDHLDVARFPLISCWEDALDAVEVLSSDAHDYQTLVVDTVDWLEPFCWKYVVDHAPADKSGRKPKSIEEVSGGFSKGYIVALEHWTILLDRLEKLQAKRGMHVVLLAHTEIKNFQNPEGENFDRYQMRLHHKAAGKLMQWVSAVLFASFEMGVVAKENKAIGVGTGARILRTEKRPAFDAKNRYGLPFRMPLSWDEFFEAVKNHQPASAEKMTDEARATAATIEGMTVKVEAMIKKAGADSERVAQVLDYVRSKAQMQQIEQADKPQEEKGE